MLPERERIALEERKRSEPKSRPQEKKAQQRRDRATVTISFYPFLYPFTCRSFI